MKRDLKSMVEFKEILKNPSPNLKVPVYTEKEGGVKPVKDTKDRITLKQVVDMMNDKFQKLDAKIDRIEQRLDYNSLQIEQINKRLDYNNLKRLPERK